jgi:hypothetical protein
VHFWQLPTGIVIVWRTTTRTHWSGLQPKIAATSVEPSLGSRGVPLLSTRVALARTFRCGAVANLANCGERGERRERRDWVVEASITSQASALTGKAP